MPGSPNMMRNVPPGSPQVHGQQRNKQMNMGGPGQQQPGAGKPMPGGQFMPQGSMPTKRDIVFPMDSVEATVPVYYRRKRIAKSDIGPVDPWRIFMALRSGLLVESTWALDVINILLFDDSSIQYFGLANLPGLLNLLLDHFQKSLRDMFESNAKQAAKSALEALEDAEREEEDNGEAAKRKRMASVDLGCVREIPDPSQRTVMFRSTTNYTMTTRKGVQVKFNTNACEEDLFVSGGKRDWDLESDPEAHLTATTGAEPWTYGHTEIQPYDYLMDCFKAEVVNIPFARYLKSKKKKNAEQEPAEGEEVVKEEPKDVVDSVEEQEKKAQPVAETVGRKGKCRNKKNVRSSSPAASASAEEAKETSAARLNGPTEPVLATEQKKLGDKTTVNGDDVTEQAMDIEEDDDEVDKNLFNLTDNVKDPARVLKRRRMSDYEDECYTRDEASLYLVNDSQDCLARRCVGISNILRNLSFVPGNELEFANSSAFLAVLGKLLLLHHTHPVRAQKTRNYDREEDVDFTDSCSSLATETEWWWDYLVQIRENMLVAAANISGHMELSRYDEIISRPVLDGLLHWAVCPSAHGQDPFPTCGPHTQLSPQRLALEALCKLCVTDANVDLVIATPPFSRLEKLCAVLTRHLCRNEEQVLREFSVNLLHYLVAADSAMARTVAMQSPCISYLVAFIEQAEQTALGVANQHGINYLRDNPDSMGTSLDMLRRAAGTLLHLSRHPDNRPLFVQQEQRLLALVMSHILDQQVALIISRVLFQVSRGTGPLLSEGVKTIVASLMNNPSKSAVAPKPSEGNKETPSGEEQQKVATEGSTAVATEANAKKDEAGDSSSTSGHKVSERKEVSVNNIDKVFNSTTPTVAKAPASEATSTESSRLGGAENEVHVKATAATSGAASETESSSSSSEVYNSAGAGGGSCGKQPGSSNATSGSTAGSPPQTTGSQILTSPIVSISSS